MRQSFLVLTALLVFGFGFGQKKYPSLLWEIQKENQKPSYLYGTMHVSERIAFHLSDVFFEKLLETDKVALESNPEVWLDEMQKSSEMGMMSSLYGMNQFYNGFALQPLQTLSLRESFMFNNMLLNGILYRTYDQIDDFQEDTYLDMFLYQSGKRTNREIVSLEDFEESRDLVTKAFKANRNFDPPAWIKKLMMEKPLGTLLENAYRDKDLDMIDSLSRGTNSEKYNEYMLFQRNENMVRRMDSIFDKGQTLFIGIGAAHLPGEKGVIEMLREKGYTVRPLVGDYTQKGRAEKERLDHAFQFSNYTKNSSSDNLISLNTASKFYEFDFPGIGISVAPDLKNGSFINLLRLKKYDFLRKDDYQSGLARVDSLLFENIPGRTLTKETKKINGFDAIEITNRTKDGDHQRYWIISTPIEYLIVSMLGKHEYVELNGPTISKTLNLKSLNSDWVETSSIRGGFKAQMPSFQTISTNDPSVAWVNNPQILAYDPSDDSHYFIIEKSLNDVKYLEDSEFEIKRMQYEFYKNLKIDSINGKLENQPLTYTSQGKINDHKTVSLKSLVNGSHYYLLGSTGNDQKTAKFFNSFQLDKFNYLKESIEHKDTTLNITVRTQYKPMNNDYNYYDYYGRADSDKNHFKGVDKTIDFVSDSRQNISVNYREFDRYESFENIDSLWNEIIRNNKKLNELEIKDKKIYRAENGDYLMDALFQKKESTQMVKSKFITNGKYFYSLKTLVPNTDNYQDDFVEEFFTSFNPNPSKLTTSIFDPKIDLFLEDANSSEDSIRSSSLKSIYQIKFKDADFPRLVNFLENYEFTEEEEAYKKSLIQKIGNLKHPKAEGFLLNYYQTNTDDSDVQISVLESFASKKNKEDYLALAQLLKEDIPLPSSRQKLYSLFNEFQSDKENTAKIIDELLVYRSIPEYQNNVISLTASLLDSGFIQANKIKSYRKDFLTLGKLELKRSYSAWKSSQNNNSYGNDYAINYVVEATMDGLTYENSNAGFSQFSMLKNYLTLLQPFDKDAEINSFLKKVDGLEIPELMLLSLDQKLKNKDEIPARLLAKLMEKQENIFPMYRIYKKANKLDDLPKQLTQEKIAESALVAQIYNFDTKKDSIKLMTLKNASYKDKNYAIYFFKTKTKNPYSNLEQSEIHSISFELDKDKSFKMEDKFMLTNGGTDYIDEEILEETYKNEVDRVLFHDKKRVNFYNYYPNSMMGY